MKKIAFIALLSSLILAGAALAQQSGEEKRGSSMRGMMEQMGDGGMQGMMGMMSKMMDQCITAHESMHKQSGHAKEGEKS